MFATLKPAILAAPLLFATAATAFAFTATPDTAPVPAERPLASVAAPVAKRAADVVMIGTLPQELPESRRHVRVVGWKFLPDSGAAMVIAGRDDAAAASVRIAADDKADRVVASTSVAAELFGVQSAMASAE